MSDVERLRQVIDEYLQWMILEEYSDKSVYAYDKILADFVGKFRKPCVSLLLLAAKALSTDKMVGSRVDAASPMVLFLIKFLLDTDFFSI